MSVSAASELYTDFSSLTSLKAKARNDQSGASSEVAKKFESLFLKMMLKSMREASITDDGILKSETMDKYRDMYDSQLTAKLAETGGIGLAKVIEQQLEGNKNIAFKQNKSFSEYRSEALFTQAFSQTLASYQKQEIKNEHHQMEFDGSVESFVKQLQPYAEKAAAVLGIQPEALLAQAALETGWGKHEMKMANGKPSHNLFSIKADHRWKGDQADVSTLEFREGIAKKERAHFRAYDSYEEAFDDYVNFITTSDRYKQAVQNASDPKVYFSTLQRAGYATDPDYADKVMAILNRDELHRASAPVTVTIEEDA